MKDIFNFNLKSRNNPTYNIRGDKLLKYTNKKQGTQLIEQIKVITFAGLPPHESIKLDCLLGTIDDWDQQYNIYSNIKVDGNPILKEALFQNITPKCKHSEIRVACNKSRAACLERFSDYDNPQYYN